MEESASTAGACTPTELAEMQRRHSNWNRWGSEDECGATNLVTPARVLGAVADVRSGQVVSLALPLDETGPQVSGRRYNPRLKMMATGTDHLHGHQRSATGLPLTGGFGVGDDSFDMSTQAGTHVDALAHIFHEGAMYNGYSAGEVTATGAARCGVENLADRLVMRGILLDVAAYLDQPVLPPGFRIDGELLDATAAHQGTEIRPGDGLLVRTGFLQSRRQQWADYCGGSAPGLSLDSARWLHAHDTAFVATDTWGVEVRPNEVAAFQPLHLVVLVHLGVPLGENFVLDELAMKCRDRDSWSFLLMMAPLPITGACGSPLNPLAVL